MKNKGLLKRIAASVLILGMMAGMTVQASSLREEAESTSLSDAQREKKELEAQLAAAQSTLKNLRNSKGNVEDKIAELNGQLITISEKITILEGQLTAKNEEIVIAKADLEVAQENAEQQYADMKVRIQYMYENGQESYAEALFSAGTVSEFLNSAEYIAQIQSYDRQKLSDFQDTVEQITALEEQLEQDYADLEVLKATVETEKQAVAALMHEREIELADITSDISEKQEDETYIKAEIQAQEELIAEIKRIEAEKAAAGEKDNPYSGGQFTWPCPSSTRITSDYGPRKSPTAGASTNHRGIDIGAAKGSDIVSAAPGKVKSVSYSSSAGNYIMVDHGGGLYTIYMHCSSIVASVGDTVAAGDVIAKVGSTGISTGPHLHFGVSLGGSYVSPWGYLSR